MFVTKGRRWKVEGSIGSFLVEFCGAVLFLIVVIILVFECGPGFVWFRLWRIGVSFIWFSPCSGLAYFCQIHPMSINRTFLKGPKWIYQTIFFLIILMHFSSEKWCTPFIFLKTILSVYQSRSHPGTKPCRSLVNNLFLKRDFITSRDDLCLERTKLQVQVSTPNHWGRQDNVIRASFLSYLEDQKTLPGS